jgi:hypothetical protein
MHAHNGLDLEALLVIDYLFHLPLEVAGVVLALCAFSLFKELEEREAGYGPEARATSPPQERAA